MNSAQDNIISNRSLSAVIKDYYQLTKPGITFAVLISMLVGFVLGSAGTINFVLMIHVIVGTYLISAGTGAHNQFIERRLDGLMNRTKERPLPSQRISARNGSIFSLTLIFTGLTYLALLVNPVAALVSFATTFIYLAAYTPMKRISATNIIIGAIPGALPPVGGWAAATGNILDPGMWLLFGIVFFWQVPHVMAIAWMCKNDYEGAGFKMLPKNDSKGIKTAFYALLSTVLLFPVTILLYTMNFSGLFFLITGLVLAVFFLVYGIRFAKDRTPQNARKLMFASIAYLPLIWVAVFVDMLF
ncbi:MAG TPA: protoheme IX farnesyltransferase [Balneolaceae bacterium]|nr:protoheme IX farnesyltransferase [Balneolaceae bacterium]|tara:strand:+ start:269219 stop:270121 length:903 start_codon:yes stop_codon:yes gene_type:complete